MPDTPDTTAVQASEQWPALVRSDLVFDPTVTDQAVRLAAALGHDPIEAGTVAAVGARLGWSELDALAAGGELAAWFDLHT
jgi:hypothetical protein